MNKQNNVGEDKSSYKMPDYDYVHQQLTKPGMTQQLVWLEYCNKCKESGDVPYQQTQFKTYYYKYLGKTKETMRANRKPWESMKADWIGQTIQLRGGGRDKEAFSAYLFVAVLPYTGYAYAEAFQDQNQEAWLTAHINATSYFRDAEWAHEPSNQKTDFGGNGLGAAVNNNYHEQREHDMHDIRVCSPNYKIAVVGSVMSISSSILAAVCGQTYSTLQDLNQAIREQIDTLNKRPFKRRKNYLTRSSEKATNRSLRARNLAEVIAWEVATVAINYHIKVDEQYYSVPHEYIGYKVDVRITRNDIEVFIGGNQICSHIRLYGQQGQYSTQKAHILKNHPHYKERICEWAASIGVNTAAVVKSMLARTKRDPQGYQACLEFLRLGEKYTSEHLEAACSEAMKCRPSLRLMRIHTILNSEQGPGYNEFL